MLSKIVKHRLIFDLNHSFSMKDDDVVESIRVYSLNNDVLVDFNDDSKICKGINRISAKLTGPYDKVMKCVKDLSCAQGLVITN